MPGPPTTDAASDAPLDGAPLDRAPLDRAVEAARESLRERELPRPAALVLTATGAGFLPQRLGRARAVPLAEVDGVPEPWRAATLHTGELGGAALWVLEDVSTEPRADSGRDPWRAGFPCWLAARHGARALVHTSAGGALPGGGAPAPGTLAVLTDHVNLSGRTPLVGLGRSKLGPLFPDASRLHDAELRGRAQEVAAERGLALHEVIAALSVGPSLDTPAERRLYAQAGAQVVVQGLEGPLLAALHAGLVSLCVVAITDGPEERLDLTKLLERAEALAPSIEDLLVTLAPHLAERAAELDDEEVASDEDAS